MTALVALVLQRAPRAAPRGARARGSKPPAASSNRSSSAFSRFAPAAVVEDIIAQGVSTRSEKKEVTVLFADLKGFTALGERARARPSW